MLSRRQQLLSLGFQAELFFQGEGAQKNTNACPESEGSMTKEQYKGIHRIYYPVCCYLSLCYFENLETPLTN